MRYHYTPIRMTKLQNTDTTECWEGYRATGTLIQCWWECRMVQSPQSIFCCSAISYKTKYTLTIWSNNHALRHLCKWVKNLSPHKNLHTGITAALCITAKTWTKPRCPSICKWINKAIHWNGIHRWKEMHYQVMKRKKKVMKRYEVTLNAYC